jgi:hypothetical protein
MPYIGNLSGISPVQRALGDVSRTVGQGFRGLGQSDLRRSESELKRAGIEREIDIFETLKRPPLEAAVKQGKAQEEYLNSEANWGESFGKDEFTAVHFAEYLQEPLAKMYGGEWDTSGGKIRLIDKKTKLPITNRDRQIRQGDEKNLHLSKMKVSSLYKDQVARIEQKMAGMDPQSPEYQKSMQNLTNAQTVLSKPEAQIPILEQQRNYLQSIGKFPKEVARINKEIAAQRKILGSQKPAKFGDTKAGKEFDRETKLKVQELKNDAAKLKKTGGFTEKQLADAPVTLEDDLYKLTHDKNGKYVKLSESGFTALKAKANAYGYDIIKTEGVRQKETFMGIDWLNPDSFINEYKLVKIDDETETPTSKEGFKLPTDIKTTSKAVMWLMDNHDMSKAEAIEWIKSQ